MKQILTICMMLINLASYSQDTLCTMVTLDEIIMFDYNTSKTISRINHKGEYTLRIEDGKVMCLHLCDEKKGYRDITTFFEDGSHMHNTFDAFDNVLYTGEDWGNVTINVSEARRRK